MLRIVCIILFSSVMAGCQSTSSYVTQEISQNSYPVDSLMGSSWYATSIAGRGLMDYPKLTLSFEDNQVVGFSGCNHLKGQYSILNSRLEIRELISTRKLCSKVLMFQEHLLLNELKKPLLLSMTDNKVIRLINNDNDITTFKMQ